MSENSSKISVVNDNGTQALRFVKTGASASTSVRFSANAQMAQIRVQGVDNSGGTRTLGLLPEERRMLLDVLERERRERLEAQKKVKQLMREYLSLDLERELQRLTEEQGLER